MDEITGRNWRVLVGDVRDGLRTLADNSVHCCVTSPPYWGQRNYGAAGQLGLEQTPDLYVAGMVDVFREVRRVLRPDGTLWVNLGDSYATGAGKAKNPGGQVKLRQSYDTKRLTNHTYPQQQPNRLPLPGLKPKDLVGIPWRVAFALQADGWYLRDCIIWAKPNPMPHPCEDRTVTAHEFIFLLAKSERYYFDPVAISEPAVSVKGSGNGYKRAERLSLQDKDGPRGNDQPYEPCETRLSRSVWAISKKSFKGAHFATFPPELPLKCILAGTSAVGCCSHCGAPWKRVVKKTRVATRPGTDSKVNRASSEPGSPYEQHSGSVVGNRDPKRHVTRVETVGWRPNCLHEGVETVPCVVLDPFSGSGTTGMVATEVNCDYVGCELNPEYAAMTEKRIGSWKQFKETKAKLTKRKTKHSRVTPVEKSLFS